ncbi:hypothetical protein CGI04_06865 [Vibrio parahaemolyticus]|nr:hypothetical protein [Vibrio parahaemolyticus]KIT21715.1 hypothetical protein H323_12155 [Vibrio parahaemolyticus VP766]KIT49770.1 hypothetical protein H334_06190 [Vibrio parahaemolyticus 901128]EGQ9519388.1 hypothetical protein [Vibrio parahaemolyticus]EGR2764160.1 hypothetical protein [Vibrio parahaemolyticus]
MSVLSNIERFLLKLERNEREVLTHYPDYVLLPIIPFFQLVHVEDIELVLKQFSPFEQGEGQFLIRLDGFVTLAADETSLQIDDLRRWTLQLLESMRY